MVYLIGGVNVTVEHILSVKMQYPWSFCIISQCSTNGVKGDLNEHS